MSKKVILIGPAGVGKTTLRKVFFEGDSSEMLLEYALEPTIGKETLVMNLSQKIGIFDLAGQEIDRWLETEANEIFTDANVIIVVVDARSPSKAIYQFTSKVLNIKKTVSPKSIVYLLAHKVDLIELKELQIKQREIYDLFKFEENLNVKFTSITKDYFSNLLALFIEILKIAVFSQEELKAINLSLLKSALNLLMQFKGNEKISKTAIKKNLMISEKNLEDLIAVLKSKNHIEISKINNEIVLSVTSEGRKYIDSVKSRFEAFDVERLEGEQIGQTKIEPEMPALIGFFVADKDGRDIMKVEVFDDALKKFIAPDKLENSMFDIQLIPMFISALEKFSNEINIGYLEGFKLKGQNLNMYIFGYKEFTMTFFINPSVNIKPLKKEIQTYFENLIKKNSATLDKVLAIGDLNIVAELSKQTKNWLIALNKTYENKLKKYEIIDFTHVKTLYDDLEEISSVVNKKYSNILEEIKSLKVELTKTATEENLESFKQLSQRINKLSKEYLK